MRAAVADGHADLCAVDCVTWGARARHEPATAAGLRVFGLERCGTGAAADHRPDGPVTALRTALQTVLADPALVRARAVLLLDGFEVLEDFGL